MTVNGALHPRGNTCRLYLHWNDGGLSFISEEDCVDEIHAWLKELRI